jgi:hypothetical protein
LFWVPIVLWLVPRHPWQALVLSVGLWAFAKVVGLNLPSHPGSGWFFNPFAWQLLITLGALAAHFGRHEGLPRSAPVVWIAAAYVLLGFLVVAPWTQIPGLEDARLLPRELLGKMDKTYLSFWRLLHVVALGYLTMILLSPQSPWLSRPLARGIGRCGRHSLEIFCLGTLLSFAGWVVLAEAGDGLVLQLLVNSIGIGMLWGTAWILEGRARAAGDETIFGRIGRRYAPGWRSQLQRV